MKKKYVLILILILILSLRISAAEEEQIYRDIKFGMTVKEFHENLRQDEKMFLSTGIPHIIIEDTEYYVFALYNQQDQLYEIYFESPSYIADYYIEKRLEELSEIVESEYGAPDMVYNFEIRDVKDEILWQKIWDLGDKIIELGVGKINTEKYVSLHQLYLPFGP